MRKEFPVDDIGMTRDQAENMVSFASNQLARAIPDAHSAAELLQLGATLRQMGAAVVGGIVMLACISVLEKAQEEGN